MVSRFTQIRFSPARRFRNGCRTRDGVDVRHRTRPRNDSVSANVKSFETINFCVINLKSERRRQIMLAPFF